MTKLAAILGAVLLAVVLVASSASASTSYGRGQWTYAEWLRLKPGMTKQHVEQSVCRCTGLGLTGTYFYNNDIRLGYVEIVYRRRNGAMHARNSWWCGMPPGQGGCEHSHNF